VRKRAPYNGEYEVIGDVGGGKTEIARKRGVEPKKPNIGPHGLDIVRGWKRLVVRVERPN
jgi:hypothetical protein